MTYKSFDGDLLREIAVAVGTPTYVYDEDTIRDRARTIKTLLAGFNSQVLYAMKANSHPRLLKIIRSEGVGIDAVSPVELKLALTCGFAPENILFSANNMTNAEMHLAHSAGVTINFGDLELFRVFAAAYPGSRACIRINPGRGSGHHAFVVTAGKESKFGISLDRLEEVKSIAEQFNIAIDGLHQHIGSGNIEIDVICESMMGFLGTAAEFDSLKFINFGGGFGIPYKPGESEIDVAKLGRLITPRLRAFLEKRDGEFMFLIEPGRYLVAESGALLVDVTNVKRVADRIFVGTNSGMNHLVRPAMYGSYHEIINLSNPHGEQKPYSVVGNICESSDFFAFDRNIPEIRIGDTLAIMDVGAYGISMASLYNLRQLPAEVLIRADQKVAIITQRVDPESAVASIIGNNVESELSIPLPR